MLRIQSTYVLSGVLETQCLDIAVLSTPSSLYGISENKLLKNLQHLSVYATGT